MSESSPEQIKVFSLNSYNEILQKEDTVDVKIIEVLDVSYSSYTWPAAPILALHLWEHKTEIIGKHILELGAGTALPGLLAAKCGAFVTLSDSALLPKSIHYLKKTCELNDLPPSQVQVIGLTWGIFTSALIKLKPVDLIIASDCFYEPKNFEDIIATVAFLFERNPAAYFLTVYQERVSDHSIEHLLNKWNLTSTTLAIDDLGRDSGVDINELMQNRTFHLLKISRNFNF